LPGSSSFFLSFFFSCLLLFSVAHTDNVLSSHRLYVALSHSLPLPLSLSLSLSLSAARAPRVNTHSRLYKAPFIIETRIACILHRAGRDVPHRIGRTVRGESRSNASQCAGPLRRLLDQSSARTNDRCDALSGEIYRRPGGPREFTERTCDNGEEESIRPIFEGQTGNRLSAGEALNDLISSPPRDSPHPSPRVQLISRSASSRAGSFGPSAKIDAEFRVAITRGRVASG